MGPHVFFLFNLVGSVINIANTLRKIKDEPKELEDIEVDQEDDFEKMYKGEISKSGAAILPSIRVRRIPEKAMVLTKEASEETEEKEESIEENKEDNLQTASETEVEDKKSE